MSIKLKLGTLTLIVLIGVSVLGGLGCDGQGNYAEVKLIAKTMQLPWAVKVVNGSGAPVPGADRAYRPGDDASSEQWSFSIQPGQRYVLTAYCSDSSGQTKSVEFHGNSNHYIQIIFHQAPDTGRCQIADVVLDGRSQGGSGGAPGSAGRSGYNLPWPIGDKLYVIQGNQSQPTHSGKMLYAWDFGEKGPNGQWVEGHQKIVAVADGTVVVSKFNATGWGYYVVIEHNSTPRYSLYAHLQEIDVKNGQHISKGCPVGRLGKTGDGARGIAHLHFQFMEALWEGKFTAPSAPGSFDEVEGGVPQEGRWYESHNQPSQSCDSK